MENFALIFVALGIGYIAQKREIFSQDTALILNQFILYISLPAMILLQVPRLELSFEALVPVVVAWLVMGVSALVIFYLSRFFGFSHEVRGSLLLVGILGNTSFLGIPIIEAYCGEEALSYVLMYDQLGSFVALLTYGTFVALYHSSHQKIQIKAIAIKIFTFPSFVALLIALLFIGTTFHPIVTNMLSSLASTIVPLALVSVGLQLRFKLPREEIKPFFVALGVKIVLAPLMAFGIVYIFSWESFAANISIMESAMGPMITAGALASMSKLAPRLSSAIVGYGTIISFVTTWLVFHIIS